MTNGHNSDIQARWDTYNARRVFLLSGIVGVVRPTSPSGRGESWHSTNLIDILAGMALLDLAHVLDYALRLKVGKRGKLADRLKRAEALGQLQAPEVLNDLRNRRNDVAHEIAPTTPGELSRFHEGVKGQLHQWGFIADNGDLTAAIVGGAWHFSGLLGMRTVRIGVLDSATHRRCWGFDIEERLEFSDPADPIGTASTLHGQETKARLY